MPNGNMRAAVAALAALLLASAAHAAGAAHEEGTLANGFPYEIARPANWNGIVVNDLDAVTEADEALPKYLLQHGYAYTGTGRHPERMTKHDPLTELDAQEAVLDIFAGKYGPAKFRIQYGCSGGGFVALAMAERSKAIDGAVAFNARGTGGMAVANTWLDLPFALKALLAPRSDLKVAPVPNDALPAAYDAWKSVLAAAQRTPQGRARVALAVAVAQWPTWGAIGKNAPAKPAADDLDALEAAMFKSASDGLANSVNRRQLYDNPAGLASWNVGVDYAKFYESGADVEQKRIVRQLYERAGLGGETGIARDLAAIDAQPRIEGSKGGVAYWLKPGRLLDGRPGVPLLHIHGLGDALLPPHLTEGYAVAVARNGDENLYRRAFVDVAGHCRHNVPEAVAAIEAMVERLEAGAWGDAGADALNAKGAALRLDQPRYVDFSFRTPFNRAFYKGSPHPF